MQFFVTLKTKQSSTSTTTIQVSAKDEFEVQAVVEKRYPGCQIENIRAK
ncbi:MAG: hypothetical protein IJ158_12220 [Treponema sp.]|nr:hypothetical protein [Treponema sp.]